MHSDNNGQSNGAGKSRLIGVSITLGIAIGVVVGVSITLTLGNLDSIIFGLSLALFLGLSLAWSIVTWPAVALRAKLSTIKNGLLGKLCHDQEAVHPTL